MGRIPPLRISTFICSTQLLVNLLGIGSLAGFAMISIYRSEQQALIYRMQMMTLHASQEMDAALAGLDADHELSPTQLTSLADAALRSSTTEFAEMGCAVYDSVGRPLSGDAPADTAILAELQIALNGGAGYAIREDAGGQATLYSAAQFGRGSRFSGILQISQSLQQGMAPARHSLLSTGLLALFIMAVTLALCARTSASFSRPIQHLNQVAGQLSQGDLKARAAPGGPLELIHLGETLNRMAWRLQTSIEALQAFVANASHELRTPLTSIKLQVGALRFGAIEEPEIAHRFLDQIESEIDRLVYTVNEMLDLSQIEGNVHAQNFQAVDLLDLACEVQAFWETRSQQAGLQLTLQHEANLPHVRGDAYRLRRLLDNLVDNAIKHTAPGGSVQIALLRGREPDMLRVEIHDTGSGIDPEHLPHIFERFYRVDAPANGNNGKPGVESRTGSGLGLAIAQSVVTMHAGKIGVNSMPGEGSTFWAELPVWNTPYSNIR